jgi:hypothetical protein
MVSNQDKPEQKIIVHVPINLRKWGGKKVVVGPVGQDLRRLDRHIRKDDKLLKALGRAYRWQKLIATGHYKNAQAISDSEKINRSYVLRVMRLMRLSPKVIQSILDGNQPDGFGLSSVEKSFPALWDEQEQLFGFK